MLSTRNNPAVSQTAARTALLGFKRPHIDVDPDDNDQIEAYIEMRKMRKRVDGAAFKKYFETRDKKINQGHLSSVDFWAVPTINFPPPPPQFIQDGLVEAGCLPDDLRHIDQTKYYVVDKEVPPR